MRLLGGANREASLVCCADVACKAVLPIDQSFPQELPSIQHVTFAPRWSADLESAKST